jgi:hypothetical protein
LAFKKKASFISFFLFFFEVCAGVCGTVTLFGLHWPQGAQADGMQGDCQDVAADSGDAAVCAAVVRLRVLYLLDGRGHVCRFGALPALPEPGVPDWTDMHAGKGSSDPSEV